MVKSPQGGMVPSVCVRIPRSLHTTTKPEPARPLPKKAQFDDRNPPDPNDDGGY